jgi:pimeloyl-ACP methyl ester carboxylesterase
VIPFIDARYRTSSEKAIYGYSMGGMFTTYILFNRPDLFKMIFIGAPGNNGRQLMPSARKYFADHTDLKSKVFLGVGSFEKETAANIDSFVNYLQLRKCPGLTIRRDFTPGAGHGAALAQVMQNAISFGYCERLTPISLDPKLLDKYTGTYVSNDGSIPDLTISVDRDKLFWIMQGQGTQPAELLPFNNTQFFMEENEKLTFTFKTENNKSILVVAPGDNKKYYFTRKE